MGPASRYPLAALETVRRRLVEEARAQLAAAVSEGVRLRARADVARQALSAANERRCKAEEGSQGGSGVELAAAARWIARLRQEELRDDAEAARSREASEGAASHEDCRRAALADAERQLRVVSRHRELWEAERRRRWEGAAEAEQDDRRPAGPGQRWT
jgi:hypothetical protein